MQRFLVSSFSLNVLSVVVLLLFMLVFLSRNRQKSPATRSLLVFLSGVTLVFASFFVIFSSLSVFVATLAWSVLHLFVFASVAMVQFGYHFPENPYPGEARRALWLCGAASLLVYPWYLFRLVRLEPVYSFDGSLFVYLNTPEAGIVIGLQILWMIVLFIRKMLLWTAIDTVLWRRLLRPADRRARAIRDVMLVFLSPVALVGAIILAYLGLLSWGLVGHILGAGFIITAFAFIVVYINHVQEPSSLMIKLVGISLGTVFIVFGLAANLAIDIRQQSCDRERRLEVEDCRRAVRDQTADHVPAAVAYIANLSTNRVFHRRNPSFTFPPTIVPPTAERFTRMLSPLDPAEFYICFTFREGDQLWEVGYSYLDFRQVLHQSALLFLYIMLGAAFLVVAVFPVFFSRCLVLPMNHLLHGVRRVNDGDLSVQVAIQVEDEIGFLSESFNRMVRSVAEAQTNLKSALDHQVKLTDSYSCFVPAEFLKFLEKGNITEIRLGDNIQREMTLLFSDIRSFTSLSEKMTPQENFDFINQYLQRIGPVVRANQGFIDKYMGDGVMALFPHEADDAVASALDMRRALKDFNADRAARHEAPIRIGVGIHTGLMMLGTIGEEKRMDGTVIADAVNLAARLEGLTKEYGVTVLISRATRNALKKPEAFRFRQLDTVCVKGKQAHLEIFEVLLPGLTPEDDAVIAHTSEFETALASYRAGDLATARPAFVDLLSKIPSDKSTQLYIDRCNLFLQHGLPDDWEGITRFEHK